MSTPARPSVLLTRRWPEAAERHLAERYRLTRNEHDLPMHADQLREALQTFDAICPTVCDRIDGAILGDGPCRTRILGNYGVGFNHIDLESCRRIGIAVTNTPDVLTESTAELAVLLMLMASRRAGEGERELRAGRWTGWRPTHLLGASLTNKTLGLVGFGRIGQATAHKAGAALGMRILYHARRRADPAVEAHLGAQHCPDLDAMLARADVVSLHCPGGAQTRHLLDAQRLSRMRRSAILINTARGEVVDEAALAGALRSGAIAGAGLDVYEHEPRVPEPLLALENVVLLPHLGSATAETRVAMGLRVADNLERFFAGEAPPDRLV